MEAIIEKLLLSEDVQILHTPLEELNLSIRVYRSLRRSRVRTIGDVAQHWSSLVPLKNIGERARGEILEALQAWSLSIPELTCPEDAEDQAENRGDVPAHDPGLRAPIEVLHLPQRTYRLLKRNRIDTIEDIYRGWHKIASLRTMGPKTLDEIHRALHPAEIYPSESDPSQGSQPAAADAAGEGTIYEVPLEVPGPSDRSIRQTKKHVITDSGAVVSADLLQAEEPRKPREERWKNVPREQVSAKPQDYAAKNTFEAIGQGPDKISSPIKRRKKILDGSLPVATEWRAMSLYLLEKARTSRQVRSINCPICMALMLSIKFKKHLVEKHPQAFRELRKAAKGSPGRQKEKHERSKRAQDQPR